jgi:hypothetical protein
LYLGRNRSSDGKAALVAFCSLAGPDGSRGLTQVPPSVRLAVLF